MDIRFQIAINDSSGRTVIANKKDKLMFVEIVKEACHCANCWERLKNVLADLNTRGVDYKIMDYHNNSRQNMIGVLFTLSKGDDPKSKLLELFSGNNLKFYDSKSSGWKNPNEVS